MTAKELIEAKETVDGLLEQLGLTAYLFEVEPHADHWQVRVECALDSGWQSSLLNVNDEALRACRTNRLIRDRLLNEWHRHLTALDTG